MEVYGEKPKKYTKDWWSYIWLYYKWHIIGTVFAIFMVVTTLNQCANRPRYDLQITAVTENELYISQIDAMERFAGEIVSDATGNGEKEIYIMPIHMSEQSDAATIQAGYAQFTVEMSMPESYVFIMSPRYTEAVLDSGILESTDVWAGGAESDGYLVSLKDNEMLKAFGIDSSANEYYLGVVKLFEKNMENELEKARYENGVRFARGLLGLEG